MDSKTLLYLCFEALALVLAIHLLITIAFQSGDISVISVDTPTAVDGLSVVVLVSAATIGLYRICVLFGLERVRDRTERMRAVFALCGCYLTILWAILHFSVGIATPSQSYFFQVSKLLFRCPNAPSDVAQARIVSHVGLISSNVVTMRFGMQSGGENLV